MGFAVWCDREGGVDKGVSEQAGTKKEIAQKARRDNLNEGWVLVGLLLEGVSEEFDTVQAEVIYLRDNNTLLYHTHSKQGRMIKTHIQQQGKETRKRRATYYRHLSYSHFISRQPKPNSRRR